MITEDLLEKTTLAWLESMEYKIIYGPDISPDCKPQERKSFKQVVLIDTLRQALQNINPHLPAKCLEDAIDILSKPQTPSLIQNNRQFQKWLSDGIKVDYQLNDRLIGDYVKLVDFNNPQNNNWLAVNQFSVQGSEYNRRPDIVIFLNGLPIIVIELKNLADEETDIVKAFNQIQTYKSQIEDLFIFNVANIISDGVNAKIGSLTADLERFMPWRTIDGKSLADNTVLELEVLIKGFFKKDFLLDYLQYFISFEEDQGTINKKIAGYHQFHAVRKAVENTLKATEGRAGVIWHTQGSGKSFSMCCYASKIMRSPEMKNPTILIITDRTDLDGQLFDTFCKAKDLLREEPIQAENRDSLRELLLNRPSGGIIFSTIQKFSLMDEEKTFPILSERSNIVVISDEAHRSQYGHNAKLNKEGAFQYGYSKHLRDALPQASFIGFTGTPIELADRDTRAVFGDYIDIYDIQQAEKDGATVQIYYESRLANLQLAENFISEIDDEFEQITESEELQIKEKLKGKWSTLATIVGNQSRLDKVAEDIINHFEKRNNSVFGKAMIVCMSREICVRMYEAITKLRPEWHDEDYLKGDIKVIMTGNSADDAMLVKHIYSKKSKKELEKRLKNPNDSLKMVIVRDMWLTGFDAPCLHTMYVDKPMKSHNLMQAIARVNRVFKDKPGGLIVDYIGIAGFLREAVRTYTESKGRGQPYKDSEQALQQFLKYLEICRGLMHGFDYSDYRISPLAVLPKATNHVLGLTDGKKRFADAVLGLSQAFSLCNT